MSSDDSPQKGRLRLPREFRLRSPEDFQRVYRAGNRAGDDNLLVFAARNDLGHSRVGVSVSKKHGGAVQRNRRKRLLRESWRLERHSLPSGLDIILIPRQTPDLTLDGLRSSLRRLLTRLDRKLGESRDDASGRSR